MLEILFLVWFCRKLAAMARSKGRSGGWGGLGAAFWIGGEITGFIVGALADSTGGSYLLALLFAGVGAAISYAIVKSLKPESSRYGYEAGPVGPMPAYAHYDPQNPYSPPRG